MKDKGIVLVGYSGHAYVVADALLKGGYILAGYCEASEKIQNPFDLMYLGNESEEQCKTNLTDVMLVVAIGDNRIREKVTQSLNLCKKITTVIHPGAIIANHVSIGAGSMVMASCTINTLCKIGRGVICNTGSVIEHEAQIGDFAHIAPGAVLAGNVTIGERTFVGANATIKQGIHVGRDVIIGAGAVVLSDISDGTVVVGNPAKKLR
jgi:acetyltransferase EpsM